MHYFKDAIIFRFSFLDWFPALRLHHVCGPRLMRLEQRHVEDWMLLH